VEFGQLQQASSGVPSVPSDWLTAAPSGCMAPVQLSPSGPAELLW